MKLKKILLAEQIYDKPILRRMIEGMLYRMRIGCPWRDVPKESGRWNSIDKKYNAWSAASKWRSVFKKWVSDPDVEWEFLDGSAVKAHQHSAGADAAPPQAIGKSRAGCTTKIHLVTDALEQCVTLAVVSPSMRSNAYAKIILVLRRIKSLVVNCLMPRFGMVT